MRSRQVLVWQVCFRKRSSLDYGPEYESVKVTARTIEEAVHKAKGRIRERGIVAVSAALVAVAS